MTETRLCALSDIADGASAGFTVGGRALFIVRRGDSVVGYVNSCPHIGAPLNFQPNGFLNVEKSHIQCSTHGALFQIDDGLCVSGPCLNAVLEPVAVSVRDGDVVVE